MKSALVHAAAAMKKTLLKLQTYKRDTGEIMHDVVSTHSLLRGRALGWDSGWGTADVV